MWNGSTSDALRATQFLISSSPHHPISSPLIQRRIVGYHQDQLGDWVAELECGHGQHVRHDPPWQVREWVTTEAGRAAHLGTTLGCVLCVEPRASSEATR